MRILFWSCGFWPRIGGIETHSITLVKGLLKAGHECIVIASQDDPLWLEDEVYHGIQLYRFPFLNMFRNKNSDGLKLIIGKVKSIIRNFNPDIIHHNYSSGSTSIIFKMIASVCSSPILAVLHGIESSHAHQFVDLLENCYSEVVTVSNFLQAQLERTAPSCQKKFSGVIYNTLDNLTVVAKSPPSSHQILCVGRLTPEKGYDVAIAAFVRVIREMKEARLILAGEGVERKNLERLVKLLNLSGAVTFLGKVKSDEVYELMSQSAVVLIPSLYESFGYTALEASLLGRPVIASDIGGLPEIIVHNKTGLLVRADCTTSLANAILYITKHPSLGQKMGDAAKEYTQKKFSVDAMVSAYINRYEKVIEKDKFKNGREAVDHSDYTYL